MSRTNKILFALDVAVFTAALISIISTITEDA
jgi:hypothetical protein